MIKAGKAHKERVIQLLAECVDKNKSVNWIVKQDSERKQRIRHLIDYSFDACIDLEQVYLNEDENGVIISSMSDDKLPFLEEAYLTARFVLQVTGVEGIAKALRREEYIKSFHPQDEEFIYIWFIAVDKAQQGRGIGAKMLKEIIDKSNNENMGIYLETSEDSNVAFYRKHGFEIYHTSEEEIFGFHLYFLRRLPGTLESTSQL
ncbi:GNAT family N-acetyltransferase [Segetibacter sp.]|jgi:ribosomal protein S18 acetylase RimI-like enzyme|uniref:GNAT family N-acetyltransferase n=1 Tax=Segetibacter sp. TaxID=2231182 RepID=UPI002602C966|nr:GNAT family N-acetyltransferase [Segetibacter sp.]MCW3079715.1 GCN5-related N-acetyltransferase [Segetibacter sp.]